MLVRLWLIKDSGNQADLTAFAVILGLGQEGGSVNPLAIDLVEAATSAIDVPALVVHLERNALRRARAPGRQRRDAFLPFGSP